MADAPSYVPVENLDLVGIAVKDQFKEKK
jgi:hypothetical protein